MTFLGDDDFQLQGGDVAIFLGHNAAALVYKHRLHVLTLFVFESNDTTASEKTIHGFHVVTWGSSGFGFALVSDINLRTLATRLQ